MKSQKLNPTKNAEGSRKRNKKRMSLKEQKFIEAYLLTGNATKSIIEAGYNTNNPNQMSSSVINRPHVKEAIDKARSKVIEKTQINFQTVLETLWDVIIKTKNEGKDDICIKAINEMNKMLGNHAPEKHYNINENHEVKEIQEVRALYKKEF